MQNHRREFLASSAALLAAHSGLPFAWAEAPTAKTKNPFLSGNYAPMREEHTVPQLKVTGIVPKALRGMYVRNGPNPQFDPMGNYHWFDGDGMLHGVELSDGRASYRNRYIHTAGYEAEKKAGKATYGGILDKPDFAKLIAGEVPYKNAANTALVWHAGKLLALWEAGEPHEIRTPSLDTVGLYRFGGKLKHAFTAHPKLDPATGEMLAFGYSPASSSVGFSIVNAKGELIQSRNVKMPRAAMMHDFAITKNYAIFPVAPQLFDMQRLAKGGSPWYFDRKLPMQFVVVSRKDASAKPQTFDAKNGFVFHWLNAHEAGDEIVLVGCRFARFPDELELGGNAKPEANPSQLYEWRMNTKTGKLREKPLDEVPEEFPRINDAFAGLPHRYGYTGRAESDFFTAVRKHDLNKGTATEHAFGKGRFGGEALFVANPEGQAEDDGWLLSFVYDAADEKSELLILDARDLAAKPLARVHLPHRVPYGFHGTWVPKI